MNALTDGPIDVAFDSKGTLYVNDHANIYRIYSDGHTEALTGVIGGPSGIAFEVFERDEILYYTNRSGDPLTDRVRWCLPEGESARDERCCSTSKSVVKRCGPTDRVSHRLSTFLAIRWADYGQPRATLMTASRQPPLGASTPPFAVQAHWATPLTKVRRRGD